MKAKVKHVYNKTKPYHKVIFTLLLIMIPILMSTFFRVAPVTLPATDIWAENSVIDNYRSQLAQQVRTQFPTLPQAQVDAEVNRQLVDVLEDNPNLQEQIDQTSEYFKSRMKDDSGQTYLLAIDPWLWYGYTKNYVNGGQYGTETVDGVDTHGLRNGRMGVKAQQGLMGTVTVFIHKVMNIFWPGTSPLTAAFYLPVILMGLATIPAFFIGRRLSNNLGGLLSAIIVGIHPALLGRTAAGFSDTDSFTVFFPLFIAFFFIEALNNKGWKSWMYMGLSIITLGFMRVAWSGWFYIFVFIVFSTLAYFGLKLIAGYKSQGLKNFAGPAKQILVGLFGFIIFGLLFTGILSSALRDTPLVETIIDSFKGPISGTIGFIELKDVGIDSVWPNVKTTVAELNSASISRAIKSIGSYFLYFIALLGTLLAVLYRKGMDKKDYGIIVAGILWMAFILKLVGDGSITSVMVFAVLVSVPIGAALLYKAWVNQLPSHLWTAILIHTWIIGLTYATATSIRFAAVLVPAFAFGFAATIAYLYDSLTTSGNREMKIGLLGLVCIGLIVEAFLIFGLTTGLVIVALIALIGYIIKMDADTETGALRRGLQFGLALLILAVVLPGQVEGAWQTSLSEVPSMNDAWYDSLIEIKDDSESMGDGIITSWWDFGHWFVSIAERRVTFDGGNQGNRIHWVGKSLLTSSEEESLAILRMLNCGQEEAFNSLDEYTGDLRGDKVVDLLNGVIMIEKEAARSRLNEAGLSSDEVSQMLEYTHCDDLIPQYYISSSDMIGKAAVWAHFGSWDFNKAAMFNVVRGADQAEGTQILTSDFGLDEAEAQKIFTEINAAENGDRWIAPWPSYRGNPQRCSLNGADLVCGNIVIDPANYTAEIGVQGGSVQADKVIRIHDGEYVVTTGDDNTNLGVIVVSSNGRTDAILADTALVESMFTKMYYFNGRGLDNFEQLGNRNSFRGDVIKTYRVTFPGYEDPWADTNEGNETVEIIE